MMKNQLKLFVMFTAGITACSQAPADAPALQTVEAPVSDNTAIATPDADIYAVDVPVIVMLGDSLTAGFGLQAGEALPEQLEIALRNQGLETHFINAGVSGDTTAGGLARYDWSVASADPDLLIISLGANDYLGGIPAEQAKTNLAAILDRAKADDLRTILLVPSPRGIDGSDPEAAAFVSNYLDLAAEYKIPISLGMLESIKNRRDFMQADQIHPTAEGVRVVAEHIATDFAVSVRELTNDASD